MPELTTAQLTIGLAAVAAVGILSLGIACVCVAKLRSVRRRYVRLSAGSDELDLVALLERWQQKLDGFDVRIDDVASLLHEHAGRLRSSLQRFGLVRFDAFEDMGGRLSFSAAFLDGEGNGMVLTSINGRTETRTYAKAIRQLGSEHNLSDEEREAIALAVSGRRSVDSPPAVSH